MKNIIKKNSKKIMKKLIFLISISGLILSIIGCGHTRIETDTYTITVRDTTYERFVNNAPGNRDNGQIVPSSRTLNNTRDMLQTDSIVERHYPDFIRMGFFEGVGLIGSSSENKLGAGLFGLYPDPKNLNDQYTGDEDALFSGGIYRFGLYEYRLRWFRDSKNWTLGVNGLEIIVPNAYTNYTFFSVATPYLRKRFYLYEDIPYVSVTLAGGLGWLPSRYINLSGSLDIGSLGGLNFRTYLGLVAGMNPESSPQIDGSNEPKKSISQVFPYLGIGVSVLDFHNLVKETETEWKDHEHSSWNIGVIQMSALGSTAEKSVFDSGDTLAKENFIKGMSIKIANASIAIPFLNNQFYAGTSLLNILLLGKNEWAVGVLPIRVGYWQTLIADELSLEPFIEYNYLPSNFFNLGGRVNLALSEMLNISLVFGFATGTTDLGFSEEITDGPMWKVIATKPMKKLFVNKIIS